MAKQEVDTIKDALKSIEQNKVQGLVEILTGCKIFECNQVFKTKLDSNNNIEQYKTKLVPKSFT